MHRLARRRWLWLVGALAWLIACAPLWAAAAFDTASARAAVQRWLPQWQAQITLVALPDHGADRYRISGTAGAAAGLHCRPPSLILTTCQTKPPSRIRTITITMPRASCMRSSAPAANAACA